MTSDMLPYLAVAASWICFGSFAVPMKWKRVRDAEVHPLVYQCYKTFWTFVTSHLVLVFQSYEFTCWGILSGFSWVPAGVASVIAVQNVGIACGQSVWQVIIIATSFSWGFVVFKDETVYSWYGTLLSLICLTAGVVGMTLSFNMQVEKVRSMLATLENHPNFDRTLSTPKASTLLSASEFAVDVLEHSVPPNGLSRSLVSPSSAVEAQGSAASLPAEKLGSFALGLSAAVFNGVWGGANLVPSHYAPYGGVRFVISFATGALIANITLVVVYIILAKVWWKCPLPSPQLRVMAIPGLVSGSLWSFGNFCSLYVVSTLGQGIGYSLVQCSVVVSGIWGILYYRELTGKPIVYWMMCCTTCLVGVFGLAWERKP